MAFDYAMQENNTHFVHPLQHNEVSPGQRVKSLANTDSDSSSISKFCSESSVFAVTPITAANGVEENLFGVPREHRASSFKLLWRQLKQRQKMAVVSLTQATEVLKSKWRRLNSDFKCHQLLLEDAGSSLIESRLDEVRSMCKDVVRPDYIFSSLPENIQCIVLKYSSVSAEQFKQEYRRNWTLRDLFRYAIRMVHITSHVALSRQKFMHWESQGNTSEFKTHEEAGKYSINYDLRDCLTKHHKFRTSRDVKQILWYLKSTQAFSSLFPSEMDQECAARVGYECYTNGRVIAYQGRPPEKFYYIISGKISEVKKYKLTLGEVNRLVHTYTKGDTTDPESMERQTKREAFLIAKGFVEVLVLYRKDYFHLSKKSEGPPIDFLKTIDIFEEFPCDKFIENPESINVRYYSSGKIIVLDSNNTPWIHVVKSGTVKVVRNQEVLDEPNESFFRARQANQLGTERKGGHADAMLGLPSRQRQQKLREPGALPQLPSHCCLVKCAQRSAQYQRWKVSRSKTVVGQLVTSSMTPCIEEQRNDEDIDLRRGSSAIVNQGPTRSTNSQNETETMPTAVMHEAAPSPGNEVIKSANKSPTRRSPVVRIPRKPTMELISKQDTEFLTREQTELSTVLTGQTNKTRCERVTYVELDVLKPTDIFGFQNLTDCKRKDSGSAVNEIIGNDENEETLPSLTLISAGAEVVRIKKRFFLDHAENNTIIKVETMYKEYMSEEAAKDSIEERTRWNSYKSILLKIITRGTRAR